MQNSRLQKYSKIIICLGGMILLSVGTLAYAQTAIPDDSWNFSQGIQQITTLFSRLWVVLAMGAGKLMGNTFVYGEFMNFDVYLWQMWNISKNFANMAIWFMFLMYVRKIVFTPDQLTGSEVGKKIGWFLLAWVLIQASWFMMGALLDIEKIATSAMGALPALVIQDDNSWWDTISDAMGDSGIRWKKLQLKKSWIDPTYLVYDGTEAAQWVDSSVEWTLDAILPSHNSLSWPLYFIWFAIFKFQHYSTLPIGTDATLKELSWIFTGTGIKFLLLAAFVVMMLMLFIINIIRIAYLRMIIALAPIIVLYIVLKDVLGMDFWSSSDGIMSKINIQTILAYIFQPTIIITFMWLILIAVTALWQEVGTSPTVIQEYGFTLSNTWVEHATFEFETKWDLFDTIWGEGKWIFKNLIILWLVFALLLWLIVLSASSLQIKFIENVAKSLWWTLAKLPMIPIWSAGQAWNNILKDTVWIDLASPGNRWKLDMRWDNALRELMGLNANNTSEDDKYLRNLSSSIGNPQNFLTAFRSRRDMRKDKGLYISWANATTWVAWALVKFIQANHDKPMFESLGLSRIQDAIKDKDPKSFWIDDLPAYIKYSNNAKSMYNALTWNKEASLPSWITAENLLAYGFKPATPKPESTTSP